MILRSQSGQVKAGPARKRHAGSPLSGGKAGLTGGFFPLGAGAGKSLTPRRRRASGAIRWGAGVPT
ncbi:hypothetical protein [Kamptonema formosum]|uniref:hypothetical protein n=1 Tax=Kamptonema formosum TaxID=331992 RepID=UPI0012DDAE2D|nr:hypothetical protein [Oscillatoria sp. PCC 10802]